MDFGGFIFLVIFAVCVGYLGYRWYQRRQQRKAPPPATPEPPTGGDG